jgi:hypothetical protein
VGLIRSDRDAVEDSSLERPRRPPHQPDREEKPMPKHVQLDDVRTDHEVDGADGGDR